MNDQNNQRESFILQTAWIPKILIPVGLLTWVITLAICMFSH
jgi:hypothetical protein